MTEVELLAKASGCRLYKQGEVIIAKEQPSTWISTTRFVLLMLSGIPLFFGLTQLVMYWKGYDIVLFVAVIFTFIGSLFGLAYWLLNKYSSKIDARPPAEFKTIC